MPSKPAESNSILNLILLNSNLMIFTELGLELKIFRNDNLNSNLNLKLRKLVNSNCTRLRCKQVNTNSNCTYWKKSSSAPAYCQTDYFPFNHTSYVLQLGHVRRMDDERIPADLLYNDLGDGKRNIDLTNLCGTKMRANAI